MSDCCNKKPEIKLSSKQTDIIIASSLNQMVIQSRLKPHRVAVCSN